MKNKLTILSIILVSTLFLASCTHESAEGENQISGKLECVDGNGICSEWVDIEAGVHYFYATYGGLELRVNADGSPYVN